jgi:hypothetical protein
MRRKRSASSGRGLRLRGGQIPWPHALRRGQGLCSMRLRSFARCDAQPDILKWCGPRSPSDTSTCPAARTPIFARPRKRLAAPGCIQLPGSLRSRQCDPITFVSPKKDALRTPSGTAAECFQRAADQFPRARWEPANDNLGILSGETAVHLLRGAALPYLGLLFPSTPRARSKCATSARSSQGLFSSCCADPNCDMVWKPRLTSQSNKGIG